jgi:transcriptional regulator GlxA family with amidase domain
MPEVAVTLFDDCQPSAVSTIIEALHVANLHWARADNEGAPPFTWRTISIDGRAVRGMGGIRLSADGSASIERHSCRLPMCKSTSTTTTI